MSKLIYLICLILTANVNLFAQMQPDINIGQYIYISKPFISHPEGRTQPNSQTKVKITVNEKGFVNSAIGLEGHPLLRAMSVQAARQTKFIPTTINGKPVRATGVITFDFQYFDAKSFAIELCPVGRICNQAQNQQSGKFNVVYGGILNGKAKSLEKPHIPDEIKAQLCKDEIVYVRVSVWGIRGGSPISAEVASGHPLLRQPAIEAALKSTFSHSNINGQDILISGLIVYRFPVDKDKPKIEIGKPINLVSPMIPGGGTISGKPSPIKVEVMIDENGNVTGAKAISGHPLFRTTCVIAASRSKFSPTKINGKTVKAKGIISYQYIPYSEFKVLSADLSPLIEKPQNNLNLLQ